MNQLEKARHISLSTDVLNRARSQSNLHTPQLNGEKQATEQHGSATELQVNEVEYNAFLTANHSTSI
jgi:hypothetical protein